MKPFTLNDIAEASGPAYLKKEVGDIWFPPDIVPDTPFVDFWRGYCDISPLIKELTREQEEAKL